MKKKLPWLKYDMKKAEYLEAKEQEKDAKLKFDEAAEALNKLREPIEWVNLPKRFGEVCDVQTFYFLLGISSVCYLWKI